VKPHRTWLAAGGVVALATLLWPGPAASADTSLGGYEGSATATVLHVEVYEPTIPIPATPQLDGSVAYSKSTVESGPTTRALASYLWPGSVIGDGFDQLVKQPGVKYPLQVNSRYPATSDGPPKNTIQLTDGNGMSTSSDGMNTSATVTLLGLAGGDTNLIGGVGTGLRQVAGTTSSATAPAVPLPVSQVLAALVTSKNITSTGAVVVGDKTVTATAHAAAANLGLLGGLISIEGIDVKSQVVSDGAKATVSGGSTIGAVKVLGQRIAIDDKGLNLGLPVLSQTVTNLLKTLGISLATIPVTKTVNGATGEMDSQVLQITIDTKPLKSILDNLLNPLLALFPQSARTQLAPLLELGPKIVLTVGDADASAGASPAYDPGSFTGGGGGDTGGGGVAPGSAGGGDSGAGGGATAGTAGADTGAAAAADTGGAAPVTTPGGMQPAAMELPALAAVPRMLILGALAFAALLGWLLRQGGGLLLGGTRSCDYGLVTGVPDLRKG
jgi:hypothetical protein